MFSFLEDFDQAVEEGREPEKPLQGGSTEHEAHDGNIHNLAGIISSSSGTEIMPQTYICCGPFP